MNSEITRLQSDWVQFSELLPELNEIVNEYIRLLYIGQLERVDLFTCILHETYTFMLNVKIKIHKTHLIDEREIVHKGEVVVVKFVKAWYKFYIDKKCYWGQIFQ